MNRPTFLAPDLMSARQLMLEADLILSNHSGGKDSGAMVALIATLAAELGVLDRVQVVHNPLGILEWPGSAQIAREHADHYGVRYVERAADADLLDLVRARRLWMDALARYCTAAMKRGPGLAYVTEAVTALGLDRTAVVLYGLGLRAQESTARAKLAPVAVHPRSSGRRTIHTWHPILRMTENQVWELHREHGLRHHTAYDQGMSRLSCSFCVLASAADLIRACQLRPELAAEYAAVEWEIGDVFKPSLSMLEAIARADGTPVDGERLALLKLRTKHNRNAYRLASARKKLTREDAPAGLTDRITTLRAACADLQNQMRAWGYEGALDRWELVG
ncbi:phosphoadenosine phosphosulfate reductase family protein [Nocardiopsis eucommiae]|uniref:Phosphoadenosine phosphosulfate reductase family protein n=1 Tax=Nocardiopsis eucommiae TaxID=2831970 RepID=A0A975L826_9ACTN|nr:phosphoadenosine phosphosulfate reductase family protein [Nocardiopsis eucommiae]